MENTSRLTGFVENKRVALGAHDVSWSLRILLLLALLLPALAAGWYAWREYNAVLDEVHDSAQRSVVALVEHADNVLEAHSLILHQIATMTNGKNWEAIAQDTLLQRTMVNMATNFEQVAVVGIADANGRVWASSARLGPERTSITDRDYFLAHKEGASSGMYFSEGHTGRLTGKRQFAISVARTDSSGNFDGVIFTAVPLDYLINFWRQFAPTDGYLIPMIRSDGMLMVRHPASEYPERLDPNGPFVTHIRRAPRGVYTAVSMVDGIERINAYSQIKDYPLYISFSLEKRHAMQEWRSAVLMAGAVAALVAAALFALSLLAIQQFRRQRIAAEQWREVADNLKHEVTRREEAEEALRHTQKMEAIGNLTGGIAHDFNNLLAGINGNLELMRIRLGEGRGDDVARHIDAAEAVVDKAAAITQRLLAFSRRQALSPRATNVNARIASMRDLIERTLGPSIRLQVSPDSHLWHTLCDPNQLDSALLNLAINARDAMPNGGELVITTKNMELDDPAEAKAAGMPCGKYVEITVRDTGIGMRPEVLARAFDPFYTTKPLGHGTGLGLSMVYGFVKQSGGEVRIDSTPGVGTAVRLYLPLFEGAAPEECETAKPSSAIHATEKATVVLVDDEAPLRSLLTELLTDMGCTVIAAADGPSALRIFETTARIDLLVTDVGLPGSMNGKTLADAVKAQQPQVKIMFVTGYLDDVARQAGLMEPGAEIMTKPFKLDEFAQKVATLIQERDTPPSN